MATTLDQLINDFRLARLFSVDNRPCALQLWVLQIKSDRLNENRILYGRLLPYSHASNTWSFSDNEDFLTFGKIKAKLTRLNLYVNSGLCAEVLKKLSAGHTISEINALLGLACPKKMLKQFGATALVADNLAYRPVAYLINRDAHERGSISSPHGSAGAFSASITQLEKRELFGFEGEYSSAIAASVVESLNAETGLDFGREDVARFGDIELLVFPSLNDLEQDLLDVDWVENPSSIVVGFNSLQVPGFDKFQFHLKIENYGDLIFSKISSITLGCDGQFKCVFDLSKELRERADSTELEVFGFPSGENCEGVLCCRWRIGYVREIDFRGLAVGQGGGSVKFDWLEKATRPNMAGRVKAALTVNRGDVGFGNHIGGRKADPWVPANRDLISLFEQIHPKKSEGRFFHRWSMGDGEGRLQFVEWFRGVLEKHQQHQIIIFDPYFETAGLGLVLICAAARSSYIVFTSLPKPSKVSEDSREEREQPNSARLNNLVANCQHNSDLLARINFRIYGLKEGRLHDRYILAVGADGVAVAGFHLSNSFQKAAENFPLLVTPIPADVLINVDEYKTTLVQEATAAGAGSNEENPTIRLLFDSADSPKPARRYEPLRFLENPEAGNVLSEWSCEPSLKGLSGDQLKVKMTTLGLIRDGSLLLADGMQNCINEEAVKSEGFTEKWMLLGEVLAHSSSDEGGGRDLERKTHFLEFLRKYLQQSFGRPHDNLNSELAVVDARLFQESIGVLLRSSYRLEHLFHATKYAALNWSEYFAIKMLWWHAPDWLLAVAEAEISNLPEDPGDCDVMRLSLLSQVVSEVALSIQFDISEMQRDRLVYSRSGLLKWMGLNAIERQLELSDGLTSALLVLKNSSSSERVRVLGWMIYHVAKDPNKSEVYKDLVTAMHEELPAMIPLDELQHLVDSLRGHMGKLAWAEPWLFRDVILPLLQSDRTTADDACEIWMQEVVSMLDPRQKSQSRLFNREREGQTTNIAAFLFAYSSPARRETSLSLISDILMRQRRLIQQPLASTSAWSQWDDALGVSLWILAFGRWSEFYLRERGFSDQKLEVLSRDARVLAMARPLEEWRSEGAGKQGELIAFLDQVEELLRKEGGLLDESR